MICPYCKEKAELVKGEELYPFFNQLKDKNYYVCWECDSRIGCHGNTKEPLGTMADSELRAKRVKAHKAFDATWRYGAMTRGTAYRYLAKRLGIGSTQCHIGMFNISQCEQTINIFNKST